MAERNTTQSPCRNLVRSSKSLQAIKALASACPNLLSFDASQMVHCCFKRLEPVPLVRNEEALVLGGTPPGVLRRAPGNPGLSGSPRSGRCDRCDAGASENRRKKVAGKPDDPLAPPGSSAGGSGADCGALSGDGRQLRVILRPTPPTEAAPYLPICDAADISS